MKRVRQPVATACLLPSRGAKTRLFLSKCIARGLTVVLLGSLPACRAGIDATSGMEPIARDAPALSFEELAARETPPLPIHQVASADGRVRLRVESLSAPQVKQVPAGDNETKYQVAILLTATTQIECVLSNKTFYPGSVLKGVWDDQTGKRQVRSFDAGVMTGRPFLAMEMLTTSDAGTAYRWETVVSLLPGTLRCFKGTPGYSESFRRIVQGMIATLERPAGPPASSFPERSIFVHMWRGYRLGYSMSESAVQPDGSRLWQSVINTMAMADQATVVSATSFTRGFSSPAGEVVRIDVELDAPTGKRSLMLERTDTRSYHVTGTDGGHPVDARFEAEDPLLDDLAIAAIRRDLIKREDGTRVRIENWDPRAGTTTKSIPLETTLLRRDGKDGPVVEVGTAEGNLCVLLDSKGWRAKSWACGGDGWYTERIYQHGAP